MKSLTIKAQRFLQGRDALARKFGEKDTSPPFRVAPDSEDYVEPAEGNFSAWRLKVGGLVECPREFSLADLKALLARTQITRFEGVLPGGNMFE